MEIINKITEFLSTIQGASVSIGLILEFIFRLIPSKKPLSIMHVVAKFAHIVSALLEKFADILDKVLPQNIENNNIKL